MLLAVKLELSEDGDFYDIKTGFITRKNYIKGKPLWEKNQSGIDSATAQSTQLPPSAISGLSTSQVSSEGTAESSDTSPEARLRAFTELLDQFIPVSMEGEQFTVDPSAVPEGPQGQDLYRICAG
jgi:hypothetical protein